jgi:DNA-binding CsgD family transcriptional regulator
VPGDRHDGVLMAVPELVARSAEIAVLHRLLDETPAHGSSVVIRGEPGVGKSALLDVVGAAARNREWRVLRTEGTPAESNLALAALHKLLRPVMGKLHRLAGPHQDALRGVFGLADRPAPDMFRLALAVMDLLAEAADPGPLLVLVDDTHWIDRSSAEVLTFIARRLDSDPILFVATSRPGSDDALAQGGLAELPVPALAAGPAATLLDSVAPDLGPDLRRSVLDAAAGNPLALLELPTAMRRDGPGPALPGLLPITQRLELSFAARAVVLPSVTRDLLLLAALNDSPRLSELLAAAGVLGAGEVGLGDIEPATSVGLLEIDREAVRFRHPLVRSAIYGSTSPSRRQAGHAALAAVLLDDPDRRIWHQAAAVLGTSEEVAAELERMAARARHRGAVQGAVAALERAAELSAGQPQRTRRLITAAEVAVDAGRTGESRRILQQVQNLPLQTSERLRVESVAELTDEAMGGGPERVRALVGLADRARLAGDRNLALGFLLRAATRCWHVHAGSDAGQRVLAGLDRLRPDPADPRALVIAAYADPVGRGPEVGTLLTRRGFRHRERPDHLLLLGHAAAVTGDFRRSETICAAAADGLRADGRLGLLAHALALQAWSALRRSRWQVALPAAQECVRLAQETRQPIVEVTGLAAQAAMAGIRGDEQDAGTKADAAERLATATRNTIGLAITQLARGLTSAGAGRPAEAFDQLYRMYQPGDPAHHQMQAWWALGSLAEAAARSGGQDGARTELARAELARFEPLAGPATTAGVDLARRYARAVLAPTGTAEDAFRDALEADWTDWPFDHGRVLLSYGGWLRRQQRVLESRSWLRDAREAFDSTEALPWADRARRELRAAGEASSAPVRTAWSDLSPQELQIAQLAAAGLGNKEIGQRMFLSHRTVGSHLYRLFPKLGVTSRAQLRHALPDPESSLARQLGQVAPAGPAIRRRADP